MNLFLSDTEINDLTGFNRTGHQAKWLRENGFYVFKLSAAGKIKIARDYVLKMMGAGEKKPSVEEVVTEPDWGALDGPQTNTRQRPAATLHKKARKDLLPGKARARA